YSAEGRGGQFIIVVPDLGLVTVFTGWNDNLRSSSMRMDERFQPSDLRPPIADAKVIARRVRQILLYSQIPFGRLNRGVPKRNLNLFERCSALMGQVREGAAHVIGSEGCSHSATILAM